MTEQLVNKPAHYNVTLDVSPRSHYAAAAGEFRAACDALKIATRAAEESAAAADRYARIGIEQAAQTYLLNAPTRASVTAFRNGYDLFNEAASLARQRERERRTAWAAYLVASQVLLSAHSHLAAAGDRTAQIPVDMIAAEAQA